MGGGALPYISQYHLPVNRPLFLSKSYTQLPHFSPQSTPNDPIFFLNFCVKFQILCTLHTFQKFCQFSAKNGNVSLKFDKNYTERPRVLGSSHHKRSNFVDLTPNDPLFSTKSYTECSLFPSTVGTYLSFSYSPPPLPRVWTEKMFCSSHDALFHRNDFTRPALFTN